MAVKTKNPHSQSSSYPGEPESNPENRSLQATVVSVFTKFIDKDTNITYALLRAEKETLYAAWRNSYFARDIMVHRKYTFSGKVKHSKNTTYFTEPTFIDVPVINKYFEFALIAPGDKNRPKSPAAKMAIGLVATAVLAGALTVFFNSNTLEQALAGRNQEVSVQTQ